MAGGGLECCPLGDRWRAAVSVGLCIVPGSSFVCGRGLFPAFLNREAKTYCKGCIDGPLVVDVRTLAQYAASHKGRVPWIVDVVL